MIRWSTPLFVLPVFAVNLPAADSQRAAMLAVAESLGLRAPVLVETDDLLVLAALPEAKLKPVAAQAQKVLKTAATVLQVPAKERPFSEQLAVYLFTDAADLRKFVRQVEKRRPDVREYAMRATGNAPYLAVAPPAGAQGTDHAGLVACWSAATLLARQVGADRRPPPEWLLAGFGRACHTQSLPQERRKATRIQLRNMLAKSQTPIWAYSIWKDDALPQRDVITASVVEYLAFGPPAEKFPAFAKALAPSLENDDEVNVEEALKLLDLTPETLDQAWKTWLQQGR